MSLTTAASASEPSAADHAGTKVLSDVIPNLTTLATDGGEVDPDMKMSVGVLLSGQTAKRDAAYRAMTTKGSSSYGRTYTPDQYAADFGVSAKTSNAVQKKVEKDGLTPAYVAKDGSYLLLRGSASQVEETFHLSVHTFTQGTTTFYANTTGATVPADVSNVLGLTDLTKMHLHADQDTCAPSKCTGITGPTALWSMYDQPNTDSTHGNLGQGQKVAIFGEGDLTQVVSDLRTFEGLTTEDTDVSKPVLPEVPVRETLVGDTQTDTSGLGEWDLDSQSSTGMSPDLAELDYYFGDSLSDDDILGTYSAWVNDPDGPAIGNSSFGGCELLNGALGDDAAFDDVLQEAVMLGRTMFASSGDEGSGGCVIAGLGLNGVTQGGLSVETPAASPFVVAVGGTVLYSAADASGTQVQPATRGEEYGWDESGGGYADFEARPDDQAALGGTLPPSMRCVGDNTGDPTNAPAACRMVPDVAAQSGDVLTNGYGIVVSGASTESGGTSLSSPLWAGMWARVRAAHAPSCATGSTVTPANPDGHLGFAQPLLYAVAENAATDNAFFDVGGLTNSMPISNGAYTTLAKTPALDPTGYDLVTGLGSPDVTNLTKALDCGSITPTTDAANPVVPGTPLPEASAPVALVGVGLLAGVALVIRRRRTA